MALVSNPRGRVEALETGGAEVHRESLLRESEAKGRRKGWGRRIPSPEGQRETRGQGLESEATPGSPTLALVARMRRKGWGRRNRTKRAREESRGQGSAAGELVEALSRESEAMGRESQSHTSRPFSETRKRSLIRRHQGEASPEKGSQPLRLVDRALRHSWCPHSSQGELVPQQRLS